MSATATARVCPTGDRVLVKPIKETTTKGGIVIPDVGREAPMRGTVVAVGPGRWWRDMGFVPVALKIGQVVIYTRYGGTEVAQDEEKFLLMPEGDVLAVVEE